ncbi:MAG: DUF308 domain-containing protein [Bacteroides sp.]|nr:DUF308 domain-containing protein [Prevotella sp.]MCM1407539.1 DUF308 domain-containing protein [Treponema brennaborense]MCM1469311.1 DUF308 domain-containing protein [Bacteroides sp.]
MMKSYVLAGIMGIILGLMMLFAPAAFIQVVVIVIGAASVVSGVLGFLTVRSLIDDVLFKRTIVVRSVLCILVGMLAVFLPLVLAGTVWTVMSYILAAELFVSAVLEIYGVIKLKSAGQTVKPYYAEILVSLIFSCILFASPAAVGITIIRFAGGLVLLAASVLTFWAVRFQPPENIRNVTPGFAVYDNSDEERAEYSSGSAETDN